MNAMRKDFQFVLSCEHASNKIPDAYETHFQHYRDLLETHRAYDLGSAGLTRFLSEQLPAPAVLALWSRLLVDVNRSLYRRTLFSEITKPLSKEARQRILTEYYDPHQQAVKKTVFESLRQKGAIFHLALHSFTPVFNGIKRDVDIGILYNPERATERALALQWRKLIQKTRPGLLVKLNRPYRGKPDGICARLRKELPDERYVGFELEINQKFYRDTKEAESLNRLILSTLSRLI